MKQKNVIFLTAVYALILLAGTFIGTPGSVIAEGNGGDPPIKDTIIGGTSYIVDTTGTQTGEMLPSEQSMITFTTWDALSILLSIH